VIDTNPATVEAPPAPAVRVPTIPSWFAVIQTIAVCGIPTQLFVFLLLFFTTDLIDLSRLDSISLEAVATITLLDTALIALLMRVFLELSGEDSKSVFLGNRRVWPEFWRGLVFVPVVFICLQILIVVIILVLPVLHTVEVSPLEQYMREPMEAAVFVVVVVLGGGIREELQRAFILHRFDQALGGIRVGLVLFSLLFAVLHFDQGWDVALAIGILGVFWGVMYIKRRSAVFGMVNHAGFNASQVILAAIARSAGGS
jgi:membrane protease YdiL (CAAX protease family)